MKFITETRINPESTPDEIPVIHGSNYYIDERGFVCTYNRQSVEVVDKNGTDINVKSIRPVTEYISIINNQLAYRTTNGFFVTDIIANKENYRGGFQGIVGFDDNSISYSYINNTSTASNFTVQGRINNSKKLEIQLGDTWVQPLGEFRCYIANVQYTITYDTLIPNTFGDTFTVTLSSWTNAEVAPSTNYIKDIHVSGNTLYLSCRLNVIGSAPNLWSTVDTGTSTVIWSEDVRLNECTFAGEPTADKFFMINRNTSTVYFVDGQDFSILQEYTHKLPIMGCNAIDKFQIAVIDKEALTVISAYISLNTWLIKIKTYFKFNQMSAYEDINDNHISEEVAFSNNIDTISIKSTQRANMLLYYLGNQITSCCHTSDNIIAGKYDTYDIVNNQLYKICKTEDNGEYEDLSSINITYESFIYIGSDLEPDLGGSTMLDTEILFEGKITLNDSMDSYESSSDKPVANDLPIRTNQNNPDNWWYLYSKTLRYPVSYTDWVKISMMPTTRIFSIKLQQQPGTEKKRR